MTPNRFPSPCVEWNPSMQLASLKNPSFYWAHILSKTLGGVPSLGLGPISGVVFSGPAGNGRHITAEALAGTLKARPSVPFYCLRTSGCALDTEDVADACAVLEQVDDVLQQGTRVCLLLDHPEHSRHSLAIQEYLFQLYLARPGKLFPILITENLSHIAPELQRRLLSCPCTKPDQAARQRWIHGHLNGKILIKFSDDTNHISIARDTKDFSWKQMSDLRMLMLRTIAFKYLASPATYNPDLTPGLEQKILTTGQVTLDRDEVQELISLVRSQAAAPSQGLVQYIAAGAPVAAAAASDGLPVSQETIVSPEDREKEIAKHKNPQNMSIGDLMDVDNL